MIDNIVNLLFRCAHVRLTRPFSPMTPRGASQVEAYVVCLDCGKQFAYDLKEMRIGGPIDRSNDASVVPPNLPMARKKKLKYAFWAAVPVTVALSLAFTSKKSKRASTAGKGQESGKAGTAESEGPENGSAAS